MTCVASGNAGVQQLEQRAFDLLIADVLMPNGNGLMLMRAFSRAQPLARILAVSGGGNHLPGGLCLKIASRFGADAVLGKPFNRDQLMAAVALALQPTEFSYENEHATGIQRDGEASCRGFRSDPSDEMYRVPGL